MKESPWCRGDTFWRQDTVFSDVFCCFWGAVVDETREMDDEEILCSGEMLF